MMVETKSRVSLFMYDRRCSESSSKQQKWSHDPEETIRINPKVITKSKFRKRSEMEEVANKPARSPATKRVRRLGIDNG